MQCHIGITAWLVVAIINVINKGCAEALEHKSYG